MTRSVAGVGKVAVSPPVGLANRIPADLAKLRRRQRQGGLRGPGQRPHRTPGGGSDPRRLKELELGSGLGQLAVQAPQVGFVAFCGHPRVRERGRRLGEPSLQLTAPDLQLGETGWRSPPVRGP
jgi:hypothetical protein